VWDTAYTNHCKRKAWADCFPQYQRQQKKQLKQDIKTALSFTITENFKPVSVQLFNNDTKELIHVDCNETSPPAAVSKKGKG